MAKKKRKKVSNPIDPILTEEQERENKELEDARIVYEAVTGKEIITKQSELYRFMNALTKEVVPFEPCCKGHATPWQVIWESYRADLQEGPPQDIIAIGPREGLKTLSTAKLIAIELLLKERIEIASVGAIMKQATRCYRHVSKYLLNPILSEMGILRKNIMEETILETGSRYEQLVGSISGVNSPHPHKLRADEVELMKSPEIIEEMKLMPSSYLNWKAHTLWTSTRKYVEGIVADLVKTAKEKKAKGPKVLIWCYKDVSEPCPDERSGVNPQIYEVEDIFHHGEKIVVEAFEYCGDCALLPSCKGDLKRAKGIIPIDDSIKKWNDLDRDKWLAQKECVEPPRTSLFYYDWDEKFNVGEYPYDRSYPAEMFFDFTGGGEDPTICQIWQTKSDTNDYLVLEIKHSHMSTPDSAREIERICNEKGIRPGVMMGDSSQMQQIRDYRAQSNFFRSLRPVRKIDRKEGLSLCRRRLKDNNGVRHTFVDRSCGNFRKEIKELKQKLHDPNDHKDGDDHSMDCWRYRTVYKYYTVGDPRIRFLSADPEDEDGSTSSVSEPIALPKEPSKESKGIYSRLDQWLREDDD